VIERMYEVQAVITRTYAVSHAGRHAREGYDLCATTHCQLYEPSRLPTSRWTQAATDALRRTTGIVLWYDTAPARAVFHADCGGHTSAAASVWGGRDRPYLLAIRDDGPADTAHMAWRFEISHPRLMRALNADPRTRVGDRLDTIEVLDRDAAGRAERVALHGRREVIVRGEDLRDVLTRAFGARTIRSTNFSVHRDRGLFAFDGRGFGHGVGLCQAGALAWLRAGATPAAVLQRYFPGTMLLTLP
jgi:stage II sporulation protein D